MSKPVPLPPRPPRRRSFPQDLSELEPRGERVTRVAWWLGIALIVAWAANYLTWPFSNDQGVLSWAGEVLRRGGMPYRDAWDVKGPVAYLLYAIPGGLFGRNEWGLRLFDLLVVAFGALSVARLVRRQASPWGVRAAVLLYLLWYASLDHHATAQPDGWVAALLAGAAALLTWHPGGGAREDVATGFGPRAVAAGALIGASILVKPTYAAMLAMPLLQGVVWLRDPRNGRQVLGHWAAVGIGVAVPIVTCVWWFAARDALDALVDVQFGWIPTSYTDVTGAWPNRVYSLLHHLTARHFAIAMPFAVAGLALAWRRQRSDAALLAGWVGAALLNVAVQANFWEYHWHALYPALAVLCGITVDALVRELPAPASTPDDALVRQGTGMRSFALVAVALLFAAALLEPAMHVYRRALRLAGLREMATWYALFGPYGRGGEFAEATRHVRANTRPDEGVLVFGGYTGVNWLADRPVPGRFAQIAPVIDPPDNARRAGYQRELFDALRAHPPRYVLALSEQYCTRRPTGDERVAAGEVPRVLRCLHDLPPLRELVLREYALERQFGMLDVWRRRDALE